MILVVMALVPKIGLAIGIVPTFMLGGTLIFMFGMIVVVGVNILAESIRSHRDILIVAASVALSTTVSFAPPAVFDACPPSVRLLAGDGIIIGTLTAVLLNLAVPKTGVVQRPGARIRRTFAYDFTGIGDDHFLNTITSDFRHFILTRGSSSGRDSDQKNEGITSLR